MSGNQQIVEALKACFDCDQPIYLLIDPIVGDFLPQLAFSDTDDTETIHSGREKAFQRPFFRVQLPPDISLSPSRHPYLVEMISPDDPWMTNSLEMAMQHSAATRAKGLAGDGWGIAKIGGWLQSAMTGEQLAEMLASWMSLNTESRTKAKYLRLADSRVLALLAHVLERDTLISRMGRLRRWAFINAAGCLDSLHNPDSGTAETVFTPLPRLNQAQWKILQNGPLIHAAIAKVLGERSRHGNRKTPQIIDIPFAAAISATDHHAARAPGVTPEDCSTAIALTLLHPGCESLGEVSEYLANEAEARTLADCGQELCDLLNNLAEKPDTSKASQHEH